MIGGVKQLGGARHLAKPGSAVATEAVNLLTFLGGDNKAGKRLLEEMRDIQLHNEKLLEEASAAIREAGRLQAIVDGSQSDLAFDTQKSHDILDQREEALSKRAASLDRKKKTDTTWYSSQKASLDERAQEAGKLAQSLEAREKALKIERDKLASLNQTVKKAQAANATRESALNARDARLQQALGG